MFKTRGHIFTLPAKFNISRSLCRTLHRVEDYGMRCRKRLPMKDDKLVAFQGWIDYTLSEPNEHFGVGDHADKKLYRTEPVSTIRAHIQQHRDQYAALVHLLAQFAYYSGVGKYTGQGMGMAQLNERKGR
ncbi:MAG: CRISPR system precrRNA processing endoribonuclease RAMP protein Cas6 [Chloroflexi bacterium]|nr:CRISPR system precrRNA processing endoribonuclease RAMP protein Cas6 [Chloroflexota bacterium]